MERTEDGTGKRRGQHYLMQKSLVGDQPDVTEPVNHAMNFSSSIKWFDNFWQHRMSSNELAPSWAFL